MCDTDICNQCRLAHVCTLMPRVVHDIQLNCHINWSKVETFININKDKEKDKDKDKDKDTLF